MTKNLNNEISSQPLENSFPLIGDVHIQPYLKTILIYNFIIYFVNNNLFKLKIKILLKKINYLYIFTFKKLKQHSL
jgi:hypothetical protein